MTTQLAERIAALDWNSITAGLDETGFAVTGPLLTAEECTDLRALYAHDPAFRKRVVMQ